MQFLHIQVTVADQLAGQHQHRNFVSVASAGAGVGIDIEDFNAYRSSLRNCSEFTQHFLAKAAPGAGIQHQMRCA